MEGPCGEVMPSRERAWVCGKVGAGSQSHRSFIRTSEKPLAKPEFWFLNIFELFSSPRTFQCWELVMIYRIFGLTLEPKPHSY